MIKEVVIVNFKSPPFPGIGGRRWGKFTHFFLSKKIKVHLVHAKWSDYPSEESYPWLHDPLLERYAIVPGKFSRHENMGMKEKIWFKFYALYARLIGGYSIFDEGRWCIQELREKLTKIAEENPIDAVFVTGPPFSWVCEVAKWKQAFSFPLWVDIRDPWLLANNWGMQQLSFIQRWKEEERYRLVFNNARYLSSPTRSLLDELPLPNVEKKKVHLKHFFDWEDWSKWQGTQVEPNLMVYSGQFYVGMEHYMGIWRKMIQDHGHLRWEIYSKDWKKFQAEFAGMEQVVIFPDCGSKVFGRLAAASGLVLCLSEYNKDYFTTKFYDYSPAEKPIVYFGPNGRVAKYLSQFKKNTVNEWYQTDNFLSSPAVFNMHHADDVLKREEKDARGQQILDLLKDE